MFVKENLKTSSKSLFYWDSRAQEAVKIVFSLFFYFKRRDLSTICQMGNVKHRLEAFQKKKKKIKVGIAPRCEFFAFYFFPSNLQFPGLLSGGEQN